MSRSFKETSELVQQELSTNQEWIERYSNYANALEDNEENIKNDKNNYHNWKPFRTYMNLSEAKKDKTKMISLRYKGQEVAVLKIKNGKVVISTKKQNNEYFKCPIELKNNCWKDNLTTEFRKWFRDNGDCGMKKKIKSREHEMESFLLNELSETTGKQEGFQCIFPIKIAGIYDFQFPTPVKASNKKVEYCGEKKDGTKGGKGGVDILARIRIGNKSHLCVIELKDENKSKEPVGKVLDQATAYATFLRELLRSESKQKWWKLFGLNHNVPDKELKIYVVSLMPYKKGEEPKEFEQLDINGDKLILQSWYYDYKEKDQISLLRPKNIKK